MIKKALIISGILLALAILLYIGFRSYTKSFSPEDVVRVREDDLEIEIEYSRPYKRDREVFGDLVPYGEVWRTGANEATIFTTTEDLLIKGKVLPAGEYTLWTIPGEELWQVIWNSETSQWGVDPFKEGLANRNPEYDELVIDAPVISPSSVFEQFTIDLNKVADDIHMVLMWDQTMIVVPMKPVN